MESIRNEQHENYPSPIEALEELKANGSVWLPGFIAAEQLHELSLLSDGLNTGLLSSRGSRVGQEFETANFLYPDETPEDINLLGMALQQYVGEALPQWRPNDVALQRYLPHHLGIEWHRDFSRDKLLVAVATIEGEARFEIEVYDRPGLSHKEAFLTRPGDVLLLRAPGLNETDDRPYHRIFPPETGVRTSIAFRQNERLEA